MLAALAVVALVNRERARHDERPLLISTALQREAQSHHGTQHTRIRACRGPRGQNLAWGYETPRNVVEAWMASPEHRANVLDPAYVSTGVGVRTAGAATVYVEDFCGKGDLPS
jgi:uncharacterized protein YkwD